MSTTNDSKTWQEIGRSKREGLLQLLPTQWLLAKVPSADDVRDGLTYSRSLLSAREVELTESLDAGQLLQALAKGDLTALEVTQAFSHRAAIAHQLTNCLSEVMFAEAQVQARKLDEYRKAHNEPIGPLHGLPISLKDQFRVEGVETSLGYVSWLGHKETAESESWLVSRLKSLGAIVYCKTNVPSSLMAIETNNNIIGYTTNAHNRLLSSGGSSGGEASLIAMRGSVLGLGSDVGASIRLPCAFSDIVGLKPSHGRVPYLGVSNSMERHETVPSVIGPMGRSISDLRLLFKTILQLDSWNVDPRIHHLPWRQDEEDAVSQKIASKKLKLGILRTDGFVHPHPPVLRAADEAAQSLRSHGFEVIEWVPPPHAEAFQILWDTFAADGGIDIHEQLSASGEQPVPELAVSYGEKVGHLPVGDVNQLWAVQKRQYDYQAKYLAYWQSTNVDAIIVPAAPSASYKPTQGRYFGYTGAFNVLDYAGVTVRTATKADPKLDALVKDYQPLNPFDETVWKDYEPEVFAGMPIGLQVICKRLEEEKVLAIAEAVEKVLLNKET